MHAVASPPVVGALQSSHENAEHQYRRQHSDMIMTRENSIIRAAPDFGWLAARDQCLH